MMGKGGWRGVGVRLGTMRGLRVCSGGLQCFPLERESVERERREGLLEMREVSVGVIRLTERNEL